MLNKQQVLKKNTLLLSNKLIAYKIKEEQSLLIKSNFNPVIIDKYKKNNFLKNKFNLSNKLLIQNQQDTELIYYHIYIYYQINIS